MQLNGKLRMAGRVRRYHTWPTVQRETTVAEHTWQVLRIWFELYGEPSPGITVAILLHDVGEGKTGDLPHMVKREHPDLRAKLVEIEKDYVGELVENIQWSDMPTRVPHVYDWDKLRIKMCDLIEAAEFALDEYHLGSRTYQHILHNVRGAFEEEVAGHRVGDSDHPHVQRARDRLAEIERLANIDRIPGRLQLTNPSFKV